MFGLEMRLAHRQPRIVGGMVGKPIAVEHRAAAISIAADDQPGILTGDMRVQPPQIGIDMIRRTEQIGEDIEEMHRRLMNKEAFHGLEIGLPVEIGVRPAPVPRPQREPELKNMSQTA